MNLLFFDIECASVNKTSAKICAFGYVLCDEKFNIIKKEDILINPKGRFHLTDRKGEKGIVLPYEYEEFKKYPPFKQVYPYIKSLLEDKNNVVLGHSTMNDIKFLNLETKRFKLPSFEFSFSDSQLIYTTFVGDYSRQFGLEHIANELGVKFTPHRAADDAFATMCVTRAMCKAKSCNYFELVKALHIKAGKIKNYIVTPPTSRGEKEYQAQVNKIKQERAKKRIAFFNYISRKKIRRGGNLSGKTFTFSRFIEDDFELAKSLIDKIYDCGGKYSQHVSQSDYYVAYSDDKTPRTLNALKIEKLKTVDVGGLEELLNGTSV